MSRPLTRPTAYGLGVRGLGIALRVMVAVFLARALGARELGAYQGVLSIGIILASLAAANAELPASRRIAAIPGDDRPALANEVGVAHLVVGLVTAVIAVTLAAVGVLAPVSVATSRTLFLVAAVTPGLAAVSLRQWIALPLRGVAASLGPEQVGLPVVFVGLAMLLSLSAELDAPEGLLAYALACWMTWVLAAWWSGILSLLVEGIRASGTSLVGSLRPRLREGRSFVVLALVGPVSAYAIVPLVAALLSLSSAGRLAIALQMAGLASVPLQIVSLAIMPRVAALRPTGDLAGVIEVVRTGSALSLGLGLGIAVIVLVSMGPVLDILGPSFAAAVDLIPVLLVGELVSAASGANSPTLVMLGMERDGVRMETVATIVRFVAIAVAASVGDILTVAWAIAATTALRNVLLSTLLHRRTGILSLPSWPHRRAFAR